jgi:hypothetical protein
MRVCTQLSDARFVRYYIELLLEGAIANIPEEITLVRLALETSGTQFPKLAQKKKKKKTESLP